MSLNITEANQVFALLRWFADSDKVGLGPAARDKAAEDALVALVAKAGNALMVSEHEDTVRAAFANRNRPAERAETATPAHEPEIVSSPPEVVV